MYANTIKNSEQTTNLSIQDIDKYFSIVTQLNISALNEVELDDNRERREEKKQMKNTHELAWMACKYKRFV